MKLTAILVSALIFTAQESPTPLIDLTNTVVLHRLREPTTASASGDTVGYSGGVQPAPPLALELVSLKKRPSDESSAMIAELEVRNTSRHDLDIPVDPSSRDVEPASGSTPYRYLTAHIWLATEPGAKERMPTQGLFLYGTKSVPKTLRILLPGQAVRILASIPGAGPLEKAAATNNGQTTPMRAFLAISNETITPEKDGHLHSHTEQVFPPVSSSAVVDLPR